MADDRRRKCVDENECQYMTRCKLKSICLSAKLFVEGAFSDRIWAGEEPVRALQEWKKKQ